MNLSEKVVTAFLVIFWLIPVVMFFIIWWVAEEVLIKIGLKQRPRPVSRVPAWMRGRLPMPGDPDYPALL